ncbi:MAG: hypothetical protein A3E88_05680 [Legionellales bacterium RIFCSPHIGHO2_12_FULL_35_11]|nr:MAG: hypothetical protein A3E88_05680 [Legionellales bacterium RIFCSPHIGHO2_12_FULL_35_11]
MSMQMSLANHFLVAMPSQTDIIFSQSVIYICDYHALGTVGLMINRPTEYSVKLLFDHLELKSSSDEISKKPLMFGGPIQPERGFVIHRPVGNWRSSLLLKDDVTITTSNDIISAIVAGKGPNDSLVTLGYAGWDTNQLEKEIIDNLWLVCPFRSDILYDVPFSSRWKEAALSIGVHMEQISGGGHA